MNPPEEAALRLVIEMVDGERRDDGVERPRERRGCIVRERQAQARAVNREPFARRIEHLRREIDAFDLRAGKPLENHFRQKTGADAKIDASKFSLADGLFEKVERGPVEGVEMRNEFASQRVIAGNGVFESGAQRVEIRFGHM